MIDCDIRAFFDTVSRDWLVRFLEHRIGDRRVRLIAKWLNAGVMDDGRWRDTGQGSRKGRSSRRFWRMSICTMSSTCDPERAEGDAIIVRYADDVVVFERKFLTALAERSTGLRPHPDKTRSSSSAGSHTEPPGEGAGPPAFDSHALLPEDPERAVRARTQARPSAWGERCRVKEVLHHDAPTRSPAGWGGS